MILAVIPARGGSKGIPRKNLRPLFGKPLIAWSIEAAREAKSIDRVVVSTEDPEIASVSREFGAEVLDRPYELATDDAGTLEVLQHVVAKIPAETVVLLQPTSPIRDHGLVDRAVQCFVEANADSLATGFMCKYVEYAKNDLRRQDLQGFFYDDGNIYVMRGDRLRHGDRYGKKIERMLIDREQNVDIDDEFDFWLAEQILDRRSTVSR